MVVRVIWVGDEVDGEWTPARVLAGDGTEAWG